MRLLHRHLRGHDNVSQ